MTGARQNRADLRMNEAMLEHVWFRFDGLSEPRPSGSDLFDPAADCSLTVAALK
jgi:hypothetical protein